MKTSQLFVAVMAALWILLAGCQTAASRDNDAAGATPRFPHRDNAEPPTSDKIGQSIRDAVETHEIAITDIIRTTGTERVRVLTDIVSLTEEQVGEIADEIREISVESAPALTGPKKHSLDLAKAVEEWHKRSREMLGRQDALSKRNLEDATDHLIAEFEGFQDQPGSPLERFDGEPSRLRRATAVIVQVAEAARNASVARPTSAAQRPRSSTSPPASSASSGRPVAAVGLLPVSAFRLLTEADLRYFSPRELTLIRNEIYARHGRTFQTAWIQAYFDSQSWYQRDPTYRDSWLSRTEARNAAFVADYQRRTGQTY